MSKAERIAFVCPRFSETGTVGGAETLLKNLALQAAAAGRKVDFLTTCATNHFTWANELKPGVKRVGGMDVHFFLVDERDVPAFRHAQDVISRRMDPLPADEDTWIRNSVNSRMLNTHLREHGGDYDCIIAGPYLFGVVYFAAQIHPHKTFLVPCLHDEPFAYTRVMKPLFDDVRGFLFNTEPERDLAKRLFQVPNGKCRVVGMGLDAFEAHRHAFAERRGMSQPYVIYSGRRETGKGTPLLCDYVHTFRERTGKDLKLVFTGSGAIEAPSELYPHIIDLGFVSEQEKHEAMAGATAFIHPSTFESLGIVLLEAWLAGVPALVHANSEVLRWQCQRSGAGLWFRHYADFEQELLMLLEKPELGRKLGAAGRSYVQREYSWESVRKRMFEAVDGGAENVERPTLNAQR